MNNTMCRELIFVFVNFRERKPRKILDVSNQPVRSVSKNHDHHRFWFWTSWPDEEERMSIKRRIALPPTAIMEYTYLKGGPKQKIIMTKFLYRES